MSLLSDFHPFMTSKRLVDSSEFWNQTNLVEMATPPLFSCVTGRQINLYSVSREEIRGLVLMPHKVVGKAVSGTQVRSHPLREN